MASKINKNKVIAAAQRYVQKGQFDKAIREYTKIVEEDPRDVRIWLKIGDLHAKKNAKKEAIDTYTKVAEFYSEQGFYLKAVAVYKQILKIDSSQVEINLCLAELYKQLGLLSDAMQQYEQVSNFYHKAGRTKEALAALRQIVDLDPENVASRIKLAELYSKEEMREEAVEEFSKAADFLRADNRMDDFIKVAERLIFHQPENLTVTKELAGLYLRKRDPRRALQKLQLSFKADPRDDETLEMLAQAFEDLGQIAKTVSVLKELANIHAENGREDRWRSIHKRILVLAPEDQDAQKALQQAGSSFPDEGRFDDEPTDEPAYKPPQRAPVAAQSLYDTGYEEEPYAPVYPGNGPEDFAQDAVYPEELAPSFEEAPETYVSPKRRFDEPEAEEPMAQVDRYDMYETEGMEPAKAQPVYGQPGGEVDVDKIITEADVYVKYGLQDKALNHLLQVFSADPHNVKAHLKLKDLYVQMGRYGDASRELLALAREYVQSDRRQAATYLNEALELDGDNHEARDLLGSLEGSALTERAPTYDDQEVTDMEAIDLDADDIVEEIPIDSADLLDDSEMLSLEGDLAEIADASIGKGIAERADVSSPSPAVIEVQAETTEPSAATEPSGEYIQLARVATQPSEVQRQAHPEEEDTQIEDDLEEAEFFLQQNLVSEARAILDEIYQRAPNHPEVRAKLNQLQELEQGGEPVDSEEPEKLDKPSATLADELAEELDEVARTESALPALQSSYSVEDVFEEVKKGTEAQIAEEDHDTHYDLGIAYREMGLLDDAIKEFRVAMQSREKEVLCHMMIGLCMIEKDQISEAISQFKTGLYVEGISERETIALYFELGQAYEGVDDLREALYYFEKVAKKDSRFRDVARRIKQIQSKAEQEGRGIGVENNGEGNPGSSSNGNIVSKVV